MASPRKSHRGNPTEGNLDTGGSTSVGAASAAKSGWRTSHDGFRSAGGIRG
ncbi:MAG: hypothetical protein KKA76_09935 [Proteobacteria bacterium]|nr:hypothetical protein [Pseudomonadota bacterium]